MNHTATRWTLTVRALTFLCLILTFEGCKGVEMASHPDSEEELVFNAEGSIVGDESLEIEFISYTDNVDLRDYQMLVEVQGPRGAYDEILSVIGQVYCGQVNENVRTAKNSIVVNAADLVESDSTVLRKGEKVYSHCIKVKMPPEVAYASIKCTLQDLAGEQYAQSTTTTRWKSQLRITIERPICFFNQIRPLSYIHNYGGLAVDLGNFVYTYNFYVDGQLLLSHDILGNGLIRGGSLEDIAQFIEVDESIKQKMQTSDCFLECILKIQGGQKIAIAKKKIDIDNPW